MCITQHITICRLSLAPGHAFQSVGYSPSEEDGANPSAHRFAHIHALIHSLTLTHAPPTFLVELNVSRAIVSMLSLNSLNFKPD